MGIWSSKKRVIIEFDEGSRMVASIEKINWSNISSREEIRLDPLKRKTGDGQGMLFKMVWKQLEDWK